MKLSPRNKVNRAHGWAGVLCSGILLACTGEHAPQSPVDPDASGLETVVAPQGQYIHFPLCEPGQTCGRINGSVDLRLVACSARISCEPKLLHDPRNLERGPTLVAGFSCGFPQGTPDQDVLLAYHPRIRCYTDGLISNPATWLPPDGIAPNLLPGDHIFYSQQAATVGDVFTNAALVMTPLKDAAPTGFCEITAWGAVAFSARGEGALVDPQCTGPGCERLRRGAHIQWAPAIRWRAIVKWSEAAGWDCYADGPTPQTWVDRVVLVAATHDLPTPEVKGELPAIQDFALMTVESRYHPETPNGHATLILRFAEDSAFPESAQALPTAMVERDLWVRNPTLGPPANVAVTWSCGELDAAGHVTRVGVLIKDTDLQAPLGAIVINRTGPTGSWDCERLPDGGCRLLEQAEWALQTPCLLPAAPL